MTTLTQHQSVLRYMGGTDEPYGTAVFGDDDDATAVVLRRTQWQDMGAPQQITVTVTPGDHLNPKD